MKLHMVLWWESGIGWLLYWRDVLPLPDDYRSTYEA